MKISIRNTAGIQVYNGQLSGTSLLLPKLSPGLYFISLQNEATGLQQQEKYIQL